ncbi:MAG TPA: ASKHA domain-containing protein [Anaerolineales bacterium]|nr:ASKHA domain-containing protein [Anaerolineales bacterium]
MTESYRIDFEPLGRRGTVRPGQTLLAAAQAAGIGLASVCGGAGTCEECRVRLVAGRLTRPSPVEEAILSKEELVAGFRLACQAEPLSDVKLDIPPESLTTSQRLQLEGQETRVIPRPAVAKPGACGLAVDIGTTKLAAYLVRLETGETLAQAGTMNPQVAYGEDVISRIAFAGHEAGGAGKLQAILVEAINRLCSEMCAQAQISTDDVLDAVLVGNTVMHHLVAGLPVEQLGRAPFSPATTLPLDIPANKIGVALGPGAKVYLPPVIAGYVGADHLAMLLASEAWKSPKNILALDIGTNTEIALVSGGKITCCSCASGPAFEGAHIHEGMRAAPGAIERTRWSDGRILWQSIDNLPPIGICGSGILDVVASLQDGKLVRRTGALQTAAGSDFILVRAAQTGLGRDIVVTRRDVHEIQLAKSAIRSGIEILLSNAGLVSADLDKVIVAGAFGTYLDLRSAVRVGMFPSLPAGRFDQVGNAAGVGARLMLISVDKRREAEKVAREINYIELTSEASFTNLYMKYLALEI